MRSTSLIRWFSVLVMLIGILPVLHAAAAEPVVPTVETRPVPYSGDAADDPAIWIHPTDPSLSTVIGTDKLGGIAVYDLAGHELQYLEIGRINNIDLRYNFPLGNERVALVTAGYKTYASPIAIYRVNPNTRLLEDVGVRTRTIGFAGHGSCMYHSPVTGKYFFLVNSPGGDVEQWELFDNGSGKVDARKVRSFSVGSRAEGCVADDETGALYIGEEDVAIWKYGAEPSAGTKRTRVDAIGSGHLVADIEGLTIYYGPNRTGYLIASSQGNNTFAIYKRGESNAYVGSFMIGSGNGIDGVEGTDGLDVTNFALGSTFGQGMFVAQDGYNDGDNTNFKFVPWERIAQSFTPALTISTAWGPRQGSLSPVTPPTPQPNLSRRTWLPFVVEGEE